MPRVTQLVMESTVMPWVIQDRVHVKPQSDHTVLASELAALSVSWPVHQVLTPWSLPFQKPACTQTFTQGTPVLQQTPWAVTGLVAEKIARVLCLPEPSPGPVLG